MLKKAIEKNQLIVNILAISLVVSAILFGFYNNNQANPKKKIQKETFVQIVVQNSSREIDFAQAVEQNCK